MVATMEPFLFGSFKLGFMDCTRATIDFLNDIDAPEAKKKMIIEHVTKVSGKVLDNKQHSPAIFTQHHDRMFANVNPPDHFMPFSLLTPHSTASRTAASTDIAGDIEWPSLHGHIPSPNLIFSTDMRQQQPKTVDVKPSMLELSSLLKIAEPKPNRMSAFDLVNKSSSCHESSPSTSASSSGGTAKINATPRRLIVHETHRLDMSEDDEDEAIDEDDNDDEKLIIDDPNNNQMTWRPWLWVWHLFGSHLLSSSTHICARRAKFLLFISWQSRRKRKKFSGRRWTTAIKSWKEEERTSIVILSDECQNTTAAKCLFPQAMSSSSKKWNDDENCFDVFCVVYLLLPFLSLTRKTTVI